MLNITICADDYALTPKVSAGIIELLDAGRITATSVMTVSEHWPDTYQQLIKFKSSADIGLHITLTDLPPLTAMPNFAPNGKLPDLKTVLKLAYLGKLPLAEIKQEVTAQLQRFYLYFGGWPSHFDGHQHIHVLPGIREIIIDLFVKFINLNGYIRNCVTPAAVILKQYNGIAKTLLINMLSWRLKRDLVRLGIATNNGFSGVYNFPIINKVINSAHNMSIWQKQYGEIFAQFLLTTNEQCLIMCHPGYVDDELKSKDPRTGPREQELRFLLSDDFLQLLTARNIALRSNNVKATATLMTTKKLEYRQAIKSNQKSFEIT